MTTAAPTVQDEETPLLGGQQTSAMGRVTERESEAATLACSSNQGSRTLSIEGRTSVGEGPRSDVTKKTPLPWAQFSITLLLLLAEHLTPQVISPVSSSVDLSPPLLWHRFTWAEEIRLSAK